MPRRPRSDGTCPGIHGHVQRRKRSLLPTSIRAGRTLSGLYSTRSLSTIEGLRATHFPNLLGAESSGSLSGDLQDAFHAVRSTPTSRDALAFATGKEGVVCGSHGRTPLTWSIVSSERSRPSCQRYDCHGGTGETLIVDAVAAFSTSHAALSEIIFDLPTPVSDTGT
ncbi:hypothetical protein BV20DRAFT_603824 [Pilatotrama ljubarskyi]|nr:hypothetical protein BV20DRAFT_603824 [Pilatotrama ljubarskyi]